MTFCCCCTRCPLHVQSQDIVPTMTMPKWDGGGRTTVCANNCQRGGISHLKIDRNDKGIMRLLTSKQATESRTDGKADGEGVARLGCKQNNQRGGCCGSPGSTGGYSFKCYAYEKFEQFDGRFPNFQ